MAYRPVPGKRIQAISVCLRRGCKDSGACLRIGSAQELRGGLVRAMRSVSIPYCYRVVALVLTEQFSIDNGYPE